LAKFEGLKGKFVVHHFPLIEKQLSTNLTVKDFCKVNGINYKTLYYWKKKYREGKKAGERISKTGFTALSVAEVVYKHHREHL
jgi:transposase-like protein